MRDCLHSYMKVGIVHFMAFPGISHGPELVNSIKRIAEDEFFGAIEIQPVPGDARDDVVKLLKSSRLAVGYCAQPVLLGEKLDLNSLDLQQRKAAVSRIKSVVDEAYVMGASKLAVLSGPAPATENQQQAKKLLIDSLAEICDYAKGKGISIVLEIFDRDVDKKCLVGPTKEAVRIASEVRKNHPNFGLMVDLSHLPLLRESPDFALKTAKDYLVHAHIGNCLMADKSHPAYGDKHPPFGVAGSENDIVQLRQFLMALLSIGYIGKGKQNIVAFEVKPLSGENPEVVVANSKRVLMEAWARL